MPRRKKNTEEGRVPARAAAQAVLLTAGRPMHYREITKTALEQGIVRARGGKGDPTFDKTMKTVRSYLAGCATKGVEFVRLGDGVYDLVDRDKAQKIVDEAIERSKQRAAR